MTTSDETSPQRWDRYCELRDLVLDDLAEEAQLAELEEWLINDPSLKRDFVESLQTRSAIAYPKDELTELSMPSLAATTPTQWPSVPKWAYVGLAAGFLFFMTTAWLYLDRGGEEGIGLIVKTENCQWQGSTIPTVPGASLHPGRLVLARGIAELRVGLVDVTMEGPADLELISTDRCFVHSGRIFAEVHPGGEGFEVQTPTSLLIDRGTVFGVNVTADGNSDLTVVKGRVDAKHLSSGTTVSVTTRDAKRFTRVGIETFKSEMEDDGVNAPLLSSADAEQTTVQISTAIGKGRDGYVMAGEQSDDKLSRTALLVKEPPNFSWGIPFRRRGYMHFDLSFVSQRTVHSAKLQLQGVPTDIGFLSLMPDATFAVYGLTDESLEDWDETTLSWKSSPGVLADDVTLDPTKTKLLGKFVVPQSDPTRMFSIDTSELGEFLNQDTNGGATLILVSETAGIKACYVHGFASRRHPDASPPTLRLSLEDGKTETPQ
ncbi:DNRLRE domain-containing protein [Novipirellula sp. SH528]|uniref:DNRLRE domain-containing protein n=1 Tax=Novipirellula sp. SH528 TaxID=3454466 RepID=UPI003F9F4F96